MRARLSSSAPQQTEITHTHTHAQSCDNSISWGVISHPDSDSSTQWQQRDLNHNMRTSLFINTRRVTVATFRSCNSWEYHTANTWIIHTLNSLDWAQIPDRLRTTTELCICTAVTLIWNSICRTEKEREWRLWDALCLLVCETYGELCVCMRECVI